MHVPRQGLFTLNMYFELLTIFVAGVVCKGWTYSHADSLSLWRFYQGAGFAPEAPLWGIDEGGQYMLIPGIPYFQKPININKGKKKKLKKPKKNSMPSRQRTKQKMFC